MGRDKLTQVAAVRFWVKKPDALWTRDVQVNSIFLLKIDLVSEPEGLSYGLPSRWRFRLYRTGGPSRFSEGLT